MFALWYLSLALDELRKHFGWTSIFDALKTNKSTKAVADKPKVTLAAPAQPTKVPEKVPEPPKPSKPEVIEKPKVQIAEPAKPKVPEIKPEPAQPKAPETKPEPPKPVVELPKPVETPKPIVELPKPAEPPKTVDVKPEQPQINFNNNIVAPNTNGNASEADKNLFAPPKSSELNEPAKTNIKEATSSFLASEGQSSSLIKKSSESLASSE